MTSPIMLWLIARAQVVPERQETHAQNITDLPNSELYVLRPVVMHSTGINCMRGAENQEASHDAFANFECGC